VLVFGAVPWAHIQINLTVVTVAESMKHILALSWSLAFLTLLPCTIGAAVGDEVGAAVGLAIGLVVCALVAPRARVAA
jgi:hypothetical protein